VAINIEERRRRRDERMAVQAANEIVQQAAANGRAITLEWATIAALVALGAVLAVAAQYRHLTATLLGCGAWAGIVLGALLCNAGLQQGSARMTYRALAVFAGLPLAVLPFYWIHTERAQLPLVVVAGAGGALVGAAVRWGWHVRGTTGSLREGAAVIGEGLGRAGSAAAAWLHDAMLKWIISLFLLAIGVGLGFVGRQQQREILFYGGLAAISLVGTVGLWAPGLRRRTRVPVALRHLGQIAFWLSLLVVPFVELGPDGSLPFTVQPSLRFVVMGIGLAIAGAAWLLQRGSIVGRQQPRPEPKDGPERALSLGLVVLGLLVTLVGLDMRQRMKLVIDQAAVSDTNLLGAVHFETPAQVRSLLIVQPLENLPIFLETVQFEDGTSVRLIPLLYPGQQLQANDHGLVKALRSAAGLNMQAFPERRVEQWTRGDGPRG
jgi:hypothetical protein